MWNQPLGVNTHSGVCIFNYLEISKIKWRHQVVMFHIAPSLTLPVVAGTGAKVMGSVELKSCRPLADIINRLMKLDQARLSPSANANANGNANAFPIPGHPE